MRVLITGGAGFIGYHLARRLIDEGRQVVLLDNFARGVRDPALAELSEHSAVELHDVDLLAEGSLDRFGTGFDAIYHLAAIIGVEHVLNRPFDVLRDNAELLVRGIDFARAQRQLKRFVFFSTSEVYAGTLKFFEMRIPTPESTPLTLTELDHPRTSYMLSKIQGEALSHHSGLPCTIVRPHNFYGPRMGLAHVIPELMQRIHAAPAGGRLEVFSVDHRRAFCYIEDAVEMIVRAAEGEAGLSETLNIGNQREEITIEELARTVLDVTGKRLTIDPRPATPGSPPRRCPDMTRTERVTGFSARVSLKEGVERTWRWYRDHVFSGGISAK